MRIPECAVIQGQYPGPLTQLCGAYETEGLRYWPLDQGAVWDMHKRSIVLNRLAPQDEIKVW